MNPQVKRVATILLTLLVGAMVFAGFWISIPFRRLRALDERYTTTARGMTKAQVLELMGEEPGRNLDGAHAWWDDVLLGEGDDARIASSLCYTVKTLFLPVTLEFTFDEVGNLVGRHRYD